VNNFSPDTDARLSADADVSGANSRFAQVGDPVTIKVDPLPFLHDGPGTVRSISPPEGWP
jgi:hypothetical protein